MVANWDCVISYRPKKFHNPQESGLDRMLRFMLYYRKSGYRKAFLEAHREEITLHKAAKAAFDESGLQNPPRNLSVLESSSADFLVYIAALRSNAPVTRIFSPRSFRVLRRAGACTKGSGIYTVHRQHKRLPGSFSPRYRRCTVQCVPGPCRFARRAPSD